MNKTMNQYKGKVLKAMMMLLAMSFALAGTSTLSSCSSDDDPYFTVRENDDPRILNTDLADSKIDRKTNYKLEIRVTPVHYTTVTWLLDGTQIYEGTTIDQTLPIGNHELKIVATTTKGKSTSRIEGYNSEPSAKSYRSRKDRMSLLARVRASPKDSMALIEQDNNSTLLTNVMKGEISKWVI